MSVEHQPNYKMNILILIAFLLIPLIYSTWTFDAALYPKTLALQLLLLVGLPVAWRNAKRWRMEALSHELPILYLIFILFSLFSLVWSTRGIVGSYDFSRYWTVGLFYVFVLLSLRNLTSDFLLKTLVVAGSVLAMMGLAQSLVGTISAPVVTMENKNFYASVMLILFSFSAVSVWLLKSGWRYLSLLSAFAIFAALLLTGARGAWVGFAVALGVTLVVGLISGVRRNLSIRFKPVAVVPTVALALVALTVFLYGANLVLITYSSSIGSNIKSIFDLEKNKRRIGYWRGTLEMVKGAPVSGVGVGNWKIEIPKYYNASHPVRPHNDFLWILAETGGIGLLIYLALIGFHFKYLIQALSSKEISRQHLIFLLGVLFATSAYLVNSMFTFPRERVYVSMLFSICLALSTHAAKKNAVPLYLTRLAHLVTSRIVSKISYVLLIVVFAITVQLAYADKYAKYLFLHHQPSSIEGNSDVATRFWNRMIDASTKAIDHWIVMHFSAYPMHWYRGRAYFELGQIQNAKVALNIASQYHPNHIGVLNSQALIEQYEGHFDEAIALYRRVLAINPNHPAVRKNLDALRKKTVIRYDPETIHTQGIEIPFKGPVEKGTVSIRPEGGDALGWGAAWTEKSVWLMPGKGKELDYGTTYIVTIETRDSAGNPLNRMFPFATKAKD